MNLPPLTTMTQQVLPKAPAFQKVAEHKGDIAAVAASASAGSSWLLVMRDGLEWAALILAVLSGIFALYWNLKRCLAERRLKLKATLKVEKHDD